MKSILQKIALQNDQFNNSGASGRSGSRDVASCTSSLNEQQDAQELLSSLISIVIEEANLNKNDNHSNKNNNKNKCRKNKYAKDERHGGRKLINRNDATIASNNLASSTSLLPSLFTRDDLNDEYEEDHTPIMDISTSMSTIFKDEDKQNDTDNEYNQISISHNVATLPAQNNCTDDYGLRKEEKKDEDQQSLSSNEVKVDSTLNKSKLSKSIQMMVQSISKDTPSPLSGCIGSTLQCCVCKHVRSTKETPFLDIPIVPNEISNAYSSFPSVNKVTSNCNGESSKLTSLSPPCTLFQCLSDFTAIERVHEVDCHACSIKSEVNSLEEKASAMQSALDSLKKKINHCSGRNKSISDSSNEALSLLQRDLGVIQERMDFLENADLDGEDDDEQDEEDSSDSDNDYADNIDELILKDLGVDLGNGDDSDKEAVSNFYFDIIGCSNRKRKLPKPRRVDANKRMLLTRLPPVLCMHVKRLYFDPVTNRNTKSLQHIEFPEYLDVSSLCSKNVCLSGDNDEHCNISNGIDTSRRDGNISLNEEEVCAQRNEKQPNYRLMSVIEHRGNAFSGHYLTYRRVVDRKTLESHGYAVTESEDKARRPNNWVVVSDRQVAFLDWEKVRKCQAYMLMYEVI